MAALFLLQIVHASTGELVKLPGGGALERELVESCTEAIVRRGVGVFRTEAQVKAAIREGITEAIHGLKVATREVVA